MRDLSADGSRFGFELPTFVGMSFAAPCSRGAGSISSFLDVPYFPRSLLACVAKAFACYGGLREAAQITKCLAALSEGVVDRRLSKFRVNSRPPSAYLWWRLSCRAPDQLVAFEMISSELS